MSIMRLRKIFNKSVRIRIGKRSISLGSPLVVVFWAIVVILLSVLTACSQEHPGSEARANRNAQ